MMTGNFSVSFPRVNNILITFKYFKQRVEFGKMYNRFWVEQQFSLKN